MATRSEELPAEAADAVTGAAVEAVGVVTDPAAEATRRVRRLERIGGPVNRRLERQIRRAAERAADTTGKLIDGSLTEKLVLRGLHLVKDQARREDVVGLAAYRSLELLHGGFGNAARSLTRFQDASQPPTRPSERRSTRSSSPARSRSGSETRSSGRNRKPATAATTAAEASTATAARTTRSTRSRRGSSDSAGESAKSA